MNEDELLDYASGSQALIEDNPQMDEANTKVRLIQPLISILGWDIHSPEVELEYPVQMGAGTKKVDYALLLEETPAVFIESKGCDTSLSESHRDQLRSYMRIVGVDWGVLTNGKEFEILKRRPNATRPEEITLGSFSINDLAKREPLLNALTKTAIVAGEDETIAENIERIRNAISTLQENKDHIADRIVDVVIDEIGESIPVKIENDAKGFVDDLVTSLQSRGPSALDGIKEDDDKYAESRFYTEVEDELGIRMSSDKLVLNEELTAVENFMNFVQFMFEKEYISEDDIPYNPGGPKRYLLNTEPKHIDNSEMYQPRELIDGVYLEAHNSTADKKRFMRKLVHDFVDE